MQNSMYSVLVGEEVMENMASPTPGMDSMAHWPGMCSKAFLPSRPTTRKVLTSGVSIRMSVTTPILGISVSSHSCHFTLPSVLMTLTMFMEMGHFAQAASAAHAAEYSVVVGGEIHQLVHEPLAEPLQLRQDGDCRAAIMVKSEYMQLSQQRKR